MDNLRESIIRNYIEGYNESDIEKMVRDLDDEILFQNVANGEVNMTIHGINDFKKQAEETKEYFEHRHQKIASIKHMDNKTEIEIEYAAFIGMDLPNGLKKGQKLELKGKSIFVFKDNRIVKLTDIS